jgi:hypothetical protein
MPAPIKGTKGNDLNLNGTNGNDKLQGKGGNDTIFGGKGNDDIDGGQGFDTAVYLGSFWDYVITVKGTGNDKVTVHDAVANRDGTDSLKQVEALQFGDGTVIRLDQNNAAVTRNDAATTNEDTSTVVDVLANDKDFEGDALTITAINGIAIAIGGSVVLASGATVTLNANQTLTYNPNGSFETLNNGGPNGSDLFQYTVTDSKGASSTGNASVTITGVNDAPVANNDTASTDEDTPVNINVRGNDTDVDVGDTLTITHVDGTAIAVGGTVAVSGGTVMLNADGTLTYTPNDALGGSTVQHNFSYTVSDGDASSTANVAVDVEGLYDVTYVVNGSVDGSAQDTPGFLFAGSGIPANGFGLVESAQTGIELGLQVIYRQGPVVLTTDDYADGVLRFSVNDGPQSAANGSFANNANRAAWSFEYSIATGLNGATTDLGDFTFKLLYDVDPGAGTSYRTLVLEAETTPPVAGQSGYQWRDVGTGLVFISDDEGNANVTQNSENYGFAFFQSFLTSAYGPGSGFVGPAVFDIMLEAYDPSNNLVARNHIAVDVIL